MIEPADILRRAADALEQAAEKATPGRWRHWNDGHVGSPDVHIGGIFAPTNNADSARWVPDAKYAALVDPTVGKALAALLRKFAENHEQWNPPSLAGYAPDSPMALAIEAARLLLREADDG